MREESRKGRKRVKEGRKEKEEKREGEKGSRKSPNKIQVKTWTDVVLRCTLVPETQLVLT